MAQVRFLAEDNSRLLDALTSTEHEAKVASSKAKLGMRTAKEVRVRQSPTVGTDMHSTRVQLNTDRERILKENVQLRAMLQEVQRNLKNLQDKVRAHARARARRAERPSLPSASHVPSMADE